MSLRTIFREGAANLRRTRLAAITSIFSLYLAIVLIGTLARTGYSIYAFLEVLRGEVEIEIFMKSISDRRTVDFQEYLEQQDWVLSAQYISKEEAAEVFRREFGAEGEGLAELDFLPASFRVRVAPEMPIDSVTARVEAIRGFDSVDDVAFNASLLEFLENRIQTLAVAGIGLGVIILVASVLLVFNTIRLTIYAKRDLIRAMKLVGATNAFIRSPFMVEGILQGAIAGLAALATVHLFFSYLIPAQLPQLGVMPWPLGRWYYLTGALFGLSVITGLWGSLLASGRFISKTDLSLETGASPRAR